MSKLFDERWQDLGLTYEEAVHGIQTAALHEINLSAADNYVRWTDTSAAGPKHLRTGVNMALVEHGAIAALLIRKGIITEEEYVEELRLAANHELWKYEEAHSPISFR